MAITHADLAPRGDRRCHLGSRYGAILMVLPILCGLCSFVLCLVAETTRSYATWALSGIEGGKEKYECVYSGSGKKPLACAAGAFLGLAVAMVVEHAYMLVSVSKTPPPVIITWGPDDSPRHNSLTRRAAFFFVATWVSFSVGEVLLIIGVGVESGHLTKWSVPRVDCLIVRPGLFLSAGIFGLTTVFLASGLYLTALEAQRLDRDEEHVRREVLNTSILYASSPPRSPLPRTIANITEDSRARDDPQLNNKSMDSFA